MKTNYVKPSPNSDYVVEPPSQTFEKLLDERAVYIDTNKVYEDKPMYDDGQDGSNGAVLTSARTPFSRTVLRGIYSDNLVNQLFFSDQNIHNLDVRLRYTIWKMSRQEYVLGPQNKTELLILMRAIYLNYAKNLNYSVTDQIRKLNDITISFVAPRLLSRTTQYLKYLEDANESFKVIIAHPVNVSNAGLKVLDMGSALGFGRA